MYMYMVYANPFPFPLGLVVASQGTRFQPKWADRPAIKTPDITIKYLFRSQK